MIDLIKDFVTIYLTIGVFVFAIVFINDVYLNIKYKQNRYRINTVIDFVIMIVCFIVIGAIVTITFPKPLWAMIKNDLPRLVKYIFAKLKSSPNH